MTHNTYPIKRQLFLYASSFLMISFLAACSDSKENDTQTQRSSTSTEIVSSANIEVSQNDNAHEIKVATKKVDKAKNDSFYYDYGEKSEYNQNAQPANEDASVRVRPRTQVDANMHVRSPYEELQVSMITRKLSKKFIVKCSACHNDYANGLIGPSLIGKDADYIYDRIQKFKTGQKVNVLMKDLINMMSDKEIRDMANEIYIFNLEIKKMRNK
jgi:cytochrome c553